MRESCKSCSKFFVCNLKKFLPFPENGCSDFEYAKKTNFVLVHRFVDTGFISIVGFSNSILELSELMHVQSRYGSVHHLYEIYLNNDFELVFGNPLPDIKDKSLINICRNVAFGLARAEYHMLKHRYTKAKFCFDKTKKQISDACYILDNY